MECDGAMINFIKIIILKIFSMFPDSPFSEYIDGMDMSYMQYINWILPVDICINIFLAWTACMMAVFVLILLKQYIFDRLIDFIVSATSDLIVPL